MRERLSSAARNSRISKSASNAPKPAQRIGNLISGSANARLAIRHALKKRQAATACRAHFAKSSSSSSSLIQRVHFSVYEDGNDDGAISSPFFCAKILGETAPSSGTIPLPACACSYAHHFSAYTLLQPSTFPYSLKQAFTELVKRGISDRFTHDKFRLAGKI